MCTIAVELDLVGEKIYNSVTGSWICVIVIQIVVDTTNTFSEKWWWFTHRSQSYEAGYRETRLRGGCGMLPCTDCTPVSRLPI